MFIKSDVFISLIIDTSETFLIIDLNFKTIALYLLRNNFVVYGSGIFSTHFFLGGRTNFYFFAYPKREKLLLLRNLVIKQPKILNKLKKCH